MKCPFSFPPLSAPYASRPPPPHFGGVGGAEGEETSEGSKESGKFVVNGLELDHEETRKAKVLYDYEADNESEMTVYCDQVGRMSALPHTQTHKHARTHTGDLGDSTAR